MKNKRQAKGLKRFTNLQNKFFWIKTKPQIHGVLTAKHSLIQLLEEPFHVASFRYKFPS